MLGSAYSLNPAIFINYGMQQKLRTATCNIQNIKTMTICLNKKSFWYSFKQHLVKVKRDPISFKITGKTTLTHVSKDCSYFPPLYYTLICTVIELVKPKTTKQFCKINHDHKISSVKKLLSCNTNLVGNIQSIIVWSQPHISFLLAIRSEG